MPSGNSKECTSSILYNQQLESPGQIVMPPHPSGFLPLGQHGVPIHQREESPSIQVAPVSSSVHQLGQDSSHFVDHSISGERPTWWADTVFFNSQYLFAHRKIDLAFSWAINHSTCGPNMFRFGLLESWASQIICLPFFWAQSG